MPRLFRTCASQLCVILVHLFNLSQEKVPFLWKTSYVVSQEEVTICPEQLRLPRPRIACDDIEGDGGACFHLSPEAVGENFT